jgi:hypothetical protein
VCELDGAPFSGGALKGLAGIAIDGPNLWVAGNGFPSLESNPLSSKSTAGAVDRRTTAGSLRLGERCQNDPNRWDDNAEAQGFI